MAYNNNLTASGSLQSGSWSVTAAQPYSSYSNAVYTKTLPQVGVYCSECNNFFNGGLGGGEAQSRDEAVVAAYANGWYIGKSLTICLECRKKINPDNVDESLLQDN